MSEKMNASGWPKPTWQREYTLPIRDGRQTTVIFPTNPDRDTKARILRKVRSEIKKK